MRVPIAVLVVLAACEAPKPIGYAPRESGPADDTGSPLDDTGGPDSDSHSDSDTDTDTDSGTDTDSDSGLDSDTDSGSGGDDSAEPGDDDGDGYTVSEDCDDGDPGVHPGATEICLDGIDQDCDGGGDGCAGQTWSVTTDLWAYESLEAGSLAGRSLATGLDLTGDGVLDVVVGSPGLDGDLYDAGSVAVAPGPLDGGVLRGVEVLSGEQKYDAAGSAVAAADLDLDGVGDLLVGAEFGATDSDGGRAYVVFGPVLDSFALSKADLCLDLPSSTDALAEVEVGEDWSGDGVPDLLISSPGAGEKAGGQVWVVDLVGALSEVSSAGGCVGLTDVSTTSRGAIIATFSGADSGDDATRVLQRDDLDGDGVAELLIGAPGHDTTAGTDAGTFYSTNSCAGLDCTLGDSSAVDVKLRGTDAEEYLGADAATADLDGDGYADLAVGASGDAASGLAPGGAVYIFAGSASFDRTSGVSDAVAVVGDLTDGEGFGRSLCGDMDANGDGLGDLLVSAAGSADEGQAYLFFGPLDGTLGTATASATFLHGTASAGLGHTRYGSAAGDITGDGLSDVVLGADFTGDTSALGAVFVLPGAYY